jgi:hypothetical protein
MAGCARGHCARPGRALRANNTSTDPPPGAGLAVQDLIQNLQFDLSSQGIQALLGDFPLVGDYG